MIRVYEEGEAQAAGGQLSLLDTLGLKPAKAEKRMTMADMLARQEEQLQEAQTAAVQSEETSEPKQTVPQLNPEQLAAVQSNAGTIAVIAGPGTGKTKSLVARIQYLIKEKGVSPKEITAVTFTHQAAQEMQARLETELGKKAVRGLTVGTFHAIALSLLPKKAIADRETRLAIMAEVLKEYGASISPASALERLSLQKNGKAAELSKAVADAYRQRLEEAGLRDLDDVLLEALALDTANRPQFRYLLVDEYQDINGVQHQLVHHWCGKDGKLFVIGDPDQSIYGFRGADASCFERLSAERPDAHIITLTQNYRSAAPVLECATVLIDRNPGENRRLSAQGNGGEPVRLMTAPDSFSEAVWIAREINAMVGGADMLSAHNPGNHRENPRAFSEMAVLCRTHRQLEQIENSLRHSSIPCVVCGREQFWEDTGVQALLGFFRWLCAPEDTVSLQEMLHGLWKVPDALCSQVQAAALESLSEQTKDQVEPQLDVQRFRARLSAFEVLTPFVDAVELLAPVCRNQQPRKLIDAWQYRTAW